MSTLHVHILTPTGSYREMNVSILNVQTIDGDRGILPHHMPLVTMLKIGRMNVIENEERVNYAIAGGMLYFHDDIAEILTDAIERSDEIDTARALAAQKRAEERLAAHDSSIDMKRAETALKKALNRLSVSGTDRI